MSSSTIIDNLEDDELQAIAEVNRTSYANIWQPLPLDKITNRKSKIAAIRLNSLGDNFFFIKFTLRKHRLSNTFHRQYCDAFLSWSLKDVFEIPRDHFKTTIGSVGMPIWWALPFTDRDEQLMRALGYDDAWIAWMRRAHNQNTRTLIVMEVIKNAWKIGKRIDSCYKSNDLFNTIFPEIAPDSSCQWSSDVKTHMRDKKKQGFDQGEGTYEFTGVDAALQSKHYERIVCDDIYGRDALKSELVAEATWEYFQLLVGAFDSDPNDPDAEIDQIVNGNRWSFHDLNWRIRKELPDFKFHTHDAEGGCCDLHPPGVPIFPEEWSLKKLNKYRIRLKDYFYSCQYRNKPIPPGGNVFKSEWLRRFVYKTIAIESYIPKTDAQIQKEYDEQIRDLQTFFSPSYAILPTKERQEKRHMAIRHEINNGIQPKDIPTSNLSKMLLMDPNHAGEKGRANNCLIELGTNKDPLNIYILDGFAENCSREDAIYHAYRMGEKWRNRTIWVETSAGQAWLKTLLEFENKNRCLLGKWYFHKVENFKDNRSENAKSDRIEDAEPYFRRGQIWIPSNDENGFFNKFLEEYNEYPHSATVDILDTLGHGLQNLQHSAMSDKELRTFTQNQQQLVTSRRSATSSITGY